MWRSRRTLRSPGVRPPAATAATQAALRLVMLMVTTVLWSPRAPRDTPDAA